MNFIQAFSYIPEKLPLKNMSCDAKCPSFLARSQVSVTGLGNECVTAEEKVRFLFRPRPIWKLSVFPLPPMLPSSRAGRGSHYPSVLAQGEMEVDRE